MKREDAIGQYEKFMLGKNSFRLWGSPHEKSDGAKEIIKYIIVEVLRWDVNEALQHLSTDIITSLKLAEIFEYIIFPKEMRGNKYEYIVELCFPSEYKFDFKKNISELYDGILNGTVLRFPREEFNDQNGYEKASIVLHQFISYNFPNSNVDELYEIFSHYSELESLLDEKKLYFVYARFYNTPLEYFHYSLDYSEQNDFLYCFYSFKNLYLNKIKEEKKEAN